VTKVTVGPDTTSDPLAELRTLVEQQRQLPVPISVRRYNRLESSIRAEMLRLAASQEAHESLLLAALSDEDKGIRLWAAAAVGRWDPPRAAQALERLIVESGGVVVRPMTMSAILAVPFEARTAAICLREMDRQADDGQVLADSGPASAGPPAAGTQLDAAEAVYGAVMSGGLDHAFAVCGHNFDSAASAFAAVGDEAAAHALREALRILLPGQDARATSLATREQILEDLATSDEQLLQTLEAAFSVAGLQARLETATET
jgi:hypothetical protein